ncbi:MAG: hypothetical protein SF097_08780 [Acidobacteriota bacterium]|nr:hypothetical protein [Acidobacteriota bacterium]
MNPNNNNLAVVYALLILIGLTSGVGDILLYKWAKAAHFGWLLAAYAVWSVSIASLGLLFKLDHFSFGAAVVLATVIHLAIGVCWSLMMTSAKVTTLEIIGLIFAAIAVVLLEMGRA